MSFSDRLVRPAALALLAATTLLAACTSGPLYGSGGLSPTSAVPGAPSDIRGLVALGPALDRTAQIFRNELLFRLNGGDPSPNPAYELRYAVTSSEASVSIEPVTGLPSASIYRMQVSYTLVRLSDGATIATGQRSAFAPFDRTGQIFASERALINAREEAGAALAQRVELAIGAAIRGQGA